MQRKKLFLFIPFIIVCISLGFYYGLTDNNNKTTPDANSTGSIYLSTYDAITSGAWTPGLTALTTNVGAGGVAWQRNDTGWLYMMGGDLDFTGNIQSRMDKYNINTNTWSSVAPMTGPDSYFGSARVKDSIYVCGGLTTNLFSVPSGRPR